MGSITNCRCVPYPKVVLGKQSSGRKHLPIGPRPQAALNPTRIGNYLKNWILLLDLPLDLFTPPKYRPFAAPLKTQLTLNERYNGNSVSLIPTTCIVNCISYYLK